MDELAKLSPQPGEEAALAIERQRLQQGERRAEAIASALSELTPRDRRGSGPASALRAAARAESPRLMPILKWLGANPRAPLLGLSMLAGSPLWYFLWLIMGLNLLLVYSVRQQDAAALRIIAAAG